MRIKIMCLLLALITVSLSKYPPRSTYVIEIINNPSFDSIATGEEYQKLSDWQIGTVANLPQVTYVEPNIGATVFRNNYLGNKKLPIELRGISGMASPFLTKVNLLEGRLLSEIECKKSLSTLHPILISEKMALEQGFKIGEVISLSAEIYFVPIGPELKNYKFPSVPKEQDLLDKVDYQFEVVGIFETEDEYLSKALLVSETVVKDILFRYQTVECNYLWDKYSKEPWFKEEEFIPAVKDKDKIATNPWFIIESKNLPEFQRMADEILLPSHTVDVIDEIN